MSTERALRVSQSIKRELSDMIRRDLKDPRLSGLISFTEVECTSDLRNVKVFVSVLGTAGNQLLADPSKSIVASGEAATETAPPKLTAAGLPELSPAEKATQGVLACLNEESGYIPRRIMPSVEIALCTGISFPPGCFARTRF